MMKNVVSQRGNVQARNIALNFVIEEVLQRILYA